VASAPRDLPRALLRDFFPVDDALLAGRYREALAALGVAPFERPRFHLDAAGYCPEVADDLGDPQYLDGGVLHSTAVIVAADQLRAPLVHPGLGWAADAYGRWTARCRGEIEKLTLREPLLVEISAGASPLASPAALADVASFEIRPRTPGGLVHGVERLEALKREFLASPRAWLDDAFIAEMLELAGSVRDLGAWSGEFTSSRHPLALFHTPAFGGSYVLEEPGASARRATTHVLAVEPGEEPPDPPEHRSARGRRVRVRSLRPESAAELLEEHGVARLDPAALQGSLASVDALRHWIAVDTLLSREPEGAPLAASDVTHRMRRLADPPPEYLEMDEVARRLRSASGRVELGPLSPLARLRLLTPTSTRGPVRRFARHVQAFLDPVHLERLWRHAPDVFFRRLGGLDARRREYFARWLAGQKGA